jgi:hypothetical protein
MKSLVLIVAACAAAAFATFACQPAEPDLTASGEATATEAVDPLDGAYAKQGGTPLHFVFRRGDADEENTFFGEIVVGSQAQRAEGTAQVGRDKLGTTLRLQISGPITATKVEGSEATVDAGNPAPAPVNDADAGASGSDGDASADSGAAASGDTRSVAQQAFSGTVHFLKIGKHDTLLVRGDENGKTAQYKKLRNWCGSAAEADCAPSVQRTGLTCKSVICTTTDKCECGM